MLRKTQKPLFRGGKFEAVQVACRLERDKLIGEIGLDHRANPRPRIADAPAAGRHDRHPIAGRYQMLALAGQMPAGPQAYDTRSTRPAAADTAGGMIDALIGGVVQKGLIDAVFHFDDLAETAAHVAGAPAVPAIFLAPDDHRRHRFEDLDRAAAHAARKSCRRHAVAERQRAHAAGGDDLDLKTLVDLRRAGLGTKDRDAPQRAGALRRYPIRDRLT